MIEAGGDRTKSHGLNQHQKASRILYDIPEPTIHSCAKKEGMETGDKEAQAKRLEAVGADTYTVDAQNYVTIAINHCSDYVLIPVRAEKQGAVQAPVAGTHTIQAGDNLWKIVNRYGCSVNDLMAANPGVNKMDLRIGQVLRIPAK